MKTKTSMIIIGLVVIALIAAGTVIGVNLVSEKPNTKQTPSTIYCTFEDNNSIISVKKGDHVNLTLQDYGDGGYTWTIVNLDEQYLKKESEQLNWGSSELLGDFGQDTWTFTSLQIGTTYLKLECARSFNITDITSAFFVTIIIK